MNSKMLIYLFKSAATFFFNQCACYVSGQSKVELDRWNHHRDGIWS